jgi:hypothetical protein
MEMTTQTVNFAVNFLNNYSNNELNNGLVAHCTFDKIETEWTNNKFIDLVPSDEINNLSSGTLAFWYNRPFLYFL